MPAPVCPHLIMIFSNIGHHPMHISKRVPLINY
jgi:hypothetical protein